MTHEWTVLRNCSSLQDAELVKSVLEGAGIDAQIPDEYTLGVDPGLTNAFGGVRVCVDPREAERAEEILSAAFK